jgi:hypothetical protein
MSAPIPIYEAIDVIEIIPESVGHTRPWVVLANTREGLKSFVVKLYNPVQVEEHFIVTREIVSNILAHEFDLKVPQFALIDIPSSLAFKQESEAQQQYDNADDRPKFATIQLNNVLSATKELPKKYFTSRIDLDTLYAFDNLIRNSDRGHPKMNLLMGSREAILIDHELALQSQNIENIDINTLQIEDSFTKYHLAYPYLKKLRGSNKQQLFNDFSGYLRLLNIKSLNPYFKQLTNEGYPDYSQPILNWLTHIKPNSTIFVNKLKGSLQ